jgi:hypothetical protein
MNIRNWPWRPIAAGLSVINVVAVVPAAAAAESAHAAIHGVLAVAFAAWAMWLQPRRADGDTSERLASLEGAVDDLRTQLTEAQERLDFAERLLARTDERVPQDRLPQG